MMKLPDNSHSMLSELEDEFELPDHDEVEGFLRGIICVVSARPNRDGI
ncbi:hypothetical protein [Rhizobium leguminosarum]|nr:hypothetical protein [Rhizobium leguminosarum]MBY5406147.1 hypothetical protein [Rhizobium leguminosarum]